MMHGHTYIEDIYVLGYYESIVLISFRRSGKTYRPIFQDTEIEEEIGFLDP